MAGARSPCRSLLADVVQKQNEQIKRCRKAEFTRIVCRGLQTSDRFATLGLLILPNFFPLGGSALAQKEPHNPERLIA